MRCALFLSILFSIAAGASVADFVALGGAIGDGGPSIGYSTDGGATFIAVPNSVSGGSVNLNGCTSLTTKGGSVVYSLPLNLWVATGCGGESGTTSGATSPDGINWSPSAGLSSIFGATYGIAWSDVQGKFVVGGSPLSGTGNHLATSTDGITWTQVSDPFRADSPGVSYSKPYGVTYSPTINRWVAITQNEHGDVSGEVAYSDDGVTWLLGTIPSPGHAGVTGVIWSTAMNKFISTWTSNGGPTGNFVIAQSTDGITWTTSANGFPSTRYAYGLATDGSVIVLVGEGTSDTLATSFDGVAVTGRGKTVFSYLGGGVCYSQIHSKWLAVGQGTNLFATSTNGITWTGLGQPVPTLFGNWGRACTARHDSNTTAVPYLVAVGSGATAIATSEDGANWKQVASPLTTGYAVEYSPEQSKWIAGGDGAVSSTNGIYWTPVTGLSSILTTVRAIAWSSTQSLWVACGIGSSKYVATSPDGVTWTGRTAPFSATCTGVAYSKALAQWVVTGAGAGGKAAIASGTADGVTWTTRVSYSQSTQGSGIAWSPTQAMWIATFTGGSSGAKTTATSTNGLTWTTQSMAFQTLARGLAIGTNGSFFVLAGDGTTDTLATTVDGSAYSGLGRSIFSTRGNAVCYSPHLSLWIAGGSGTNTLAVSLSGSSWTGLGTSAITTQAEGCASYYTVAQSQT